MKPTARDEQSRALLEVEPRGSNFVSNQALTCALSTHLEPGRAWGYAETATHMVAAGMPRGEGALARFAEWSRSMGRRPLVFACEPQDLNELEGWKVVELGRQPVFRTGDLFRPELCGVDQPAAHREMRRQARRASSKGVVVEELSQGRLWELVAGGQLESLLKSRRTRQPLPEFGFLVGLNLGCGGQVRRYFLASSAEGDCLGLAITVESGRGFLLEHQMLCATAPNGTGELFLCRILSEFLPPGQLLSLGITPLYRSLVGDPPEAEGPSILSFLPRALRDGLMRAWEPLYGFRSLLNFRRKLEPDDWEPVFWAHRGSRLLALLAVLQAFAGGSFWLFAGRTVVKFWRQWCSRFTRSQMRLGNTFFVVSLALWIPILWHLDGTWLFGFPQATRVWATYDFCLVLGFIVHGWGLQAGRPGATGMVLLGLVMADAMLSWIQTAFVHLGHPTAFSLKLFLFVINSAPLAAALFLAVCQGASFPLSRRDVIRA